MNNISGRGRVLQAALGAVFTFSIPTLLSAGAASANVIPDLCNTGLATVCFGGPTDGPLPTPGSPGPADPIWELSTTVLPSGSSIVIPPASTFLPGSAFVNTPDPGWLSDGTNSQWITPKTEKSDGGVYFYQDTFDIPSPDNPLTAEIDGVWTSDNEGLAVYVNGNPVTTGITFPGPADSGSFTGMFDITDANATFNSGLNTLDFVVRNRGLHGIDSNPTDTGLRVEFNSDSVAVPEPSTLALFGVGLVGLGLLGRRRRGTRSQ